MHANGGNVNQVRNNRNKNANRNLTVQSCNQQLKLLVKVATQIAVFA